MLKNYKDIFRVWFDEMGEPVAMMLENGHDTVYRVQRASRQDKDQLFETLPPNETINS